MRLVAGIVAGLGVLLAVASPAMAAVTTWKLSSKVVSNVGDVMVTGTNTDNDPLSQGQWFSDPAAVSATDFGTAHWTAHVYCRDDSGAAGFFWRLVENPAGGGEVEANEGNVGSCGNPSVVDIAPTGDFTLPAGARLRFDVTPGGNSFFANGDGQVYTGGANPQSTLSSPDVGGGVPTPEIPSALLFLGAAAIVAGVVVVRRRK